ncbi:MAG: hypothetical protein WC551_11465 [Patescibacteria group bacterium]
MRGSNIIRSEHSPFRIVPERGQVPEYGIEVSAGNKARYVFQECEAWSYDAKDFEGGRPHVAGVIGPGPLSGDGKGLARESGGNDINHSLIACGVPFTDESPDIAEDGGSIEVAVLDSLNNDPLAIRFKFNISHRPPS